MNVQAAPAGHFAWIADRLRLPVPSDFKAIEAMDERGRIRGMLGFGNWTKTSVHVHLALESPSVLRHLLGPAFEFPFEQAGRSLLVSPVPSHAAPAVRLLKHLGFREAYRHRDGFDVGDDMILFEMTKDECRWLAPRLKEAARYAH